MPDITYSNLALSENRRNLFCPVLTQPVVHTPVPKRRGLVESSLSCAQRREATFADIAVIV